MDAPRHGERSAAAEEQRRRCSAVVESLRQESWQDREPSVRING